MRGNEFWLDESYVTFFNKMTANFQKVYFLQNPTNQDLKYFIGSFIKTGALDDNESHLFVLKCIITELKLN